ncbi:hypothetical protein OG413_06730 [Streptomyces sp. NBC_01433]|uniref:hypothetical protein n=1 Tax=Streptomyces sp. NBC_01433 TaxID=2903864 RepID=UPI00225AB8F5|nr:hypothetical protein [Streptomyces sp. NBC_01433]MCX4675021.1 hypothetical protein [Streptomyces sp. NBC_01433]
MSDTLGRVSFLDGFPDKDRMRAEEFERDECMEELATLCDSRPEVFDRMGTTARIGLGYYENDKKNAAAHGVDVTKESN